MKQRIAMVALLLAVLSGYLWLQSHPQGEAV
ncbi:hypothetical protein SH16_03949 [Aeromonas caviae]|jgi:hypothetical protein|nr:hypothetical protein SH16_03949 [Aeromonas caviae]BBQ51028.1 hypothetical protein WP2S18C03_01090 [Aeromonas veronii]BBS15134.1 hypothetical protein WP5W18E02_01710 [Aeromonas caviae]SIR05660.1 hypothetical protein SAMN05880569_106105 [Aeromonas hydrophila]SIR29231.1 hypothetical protein SAMN05878295_107105 [Aeromonas hydrophila]